MQLEKIYEPNQFESRWAQWWVESGIYKPNLIPGNRVFSLVIPPPTSPAPCTWGTCWSTPKSTSPSVTAA